MRIGIEDVLAFEVQQAAPQPERAFVHLAWPRLRARRDDAGRGWLLRRSQGGFKHIVGNATESFPFGRLIRTDPRLGQRIELRRASAMKLNPSARLALLEVSRLVVPPYVRLEV